jgi:hypothetical protein
VKVRIVTLDLRGLDGPGAVEAAHRLLAAEPDVTNMLFVDSASLIAEHADCYELLLGTANRVERHLFVVAGRQDGGRGLVLPGNFRRAVIWVPDPIGIDWPYRAGAAAKRHVGHAADEGLRRLIEILGIPDLFLRALLLVEEMPYGLACPALRLGAGESREYDEFRWALRLALDQLLLPSDVPLHPVDDLVTPSADKDPLRPGGRLAGEVQNAGNAVKDAQYLLGRLVSRGALYTALEPIPDAMRIAGDSLDALWAVLEKFLTDVEVAEHPEDVMAAHGLVLKARPQVADQDVELGELRTMVDRSTRRWLADGASLPQIEESVGAWADRLAADGSLRATLRNARPGDLIDTLRTPAPFPGPQRWLPLVGAALAALAGLSPPAIIAGVLFGVVWAGLGLLSVLRAPNTVLAGNRVFVLGNAVLALAGGVGGGMAAKAAVVPPALWMAALAVAVAGGIVVPAYAFARRAQEWTRMIQAERGLAALDALHGWFGRLAAEWSAQPLRSAFRAVLQKVEFAVGGTRKALSERRTRLLTETAGRPPHVPTAFLQTVRQQLSALVVSTLRPSLETLGEGDSATHGRNAVARAHKRLAELQAHADDPGSTSPEWLTTDLEAAPVTDISEDLAELTRAAAYDPTQEMWQLCAATDVGLLDVVPGLPAAVRFAPQRARPSFESLAPTDTVWGPAGHSGVLRLTGLKPGAIEWSWSDGAENQIGADW